MRVWTIPTSFLGTLWQLSDYAVKIFQVFNPTLLILFSSSWVQPTITCYFWRAASLWLFPGLTRQNSVNSTRAASSGGQSFLVIDRQQWFWHTGQWRGFPLLNVFLAFSLYSVYFFAPTPSSSFLPFNLEWGLWRQWPQVPVHQEWQDAWQ